MKELKEKIGKNVEMLCERYPALESVKKEIPVSFEINLATSFPFFKIIISLPSWTAFKYLPKLF